MKRRFFLFAAPAIVAAPSLMKISTALFTVPPDVSAWRFDVLYGTKLFQPSLVTNGMVLRMARASLETNRLAEMLIVRDFFAGDRWPEDEKITVRRPIRINRIPPLQIP